MVTLKNGDQRKVNEASQLLAKAQAKLASIDKRAYRNAPEIKQTLTAAQVAASTDAVALSELAHR